MEDTKPKELPKGRTLKEFLAIKVEPKQCAWDGCEAWSNKTAFKHCCGFVGQRDSKPCERKAYCVHHFYRHLAKAHPTEAKNRGCDDTKKLL